MNGHNWKIQEGFLREARPGEWIYSRKIHSRAPERRVCHWKQYWGTLLRVAKSKPGIVPYTRTVISTYFLISLSSVSTFSTLSSKLTHSLDNSLRITYMLGTILYSSNIKMSKNKCLSA